MSERDLVMRTERLSAAEATWQELFNQSPAATPFTSHEWFTSLAKNILKIDPQVLLFQSNKAIVGIIPGIVTDNILHLLGDERVTDFNDMICVPGYEEKIVHFLADYIVENDLRIDLYPLEKSSPLVTGLSKHMPELTVRKKDSCPLLNLSTTWEEYLAGLDGKARHELRRKMKKVNGVLLKDVQPVDTERFFELMERSGKEKANFLNEETKGFFKDLVDAFYNRGWLRMRVAVIEERVLGMLLAFGFRGRVYLFNMGFDPGLRNLSPGIVTVGLDIKRAIEEKYQHYDFLRGDEDYKYRLGAAERYTVRVAR
jgi:CelD/BcsL family acetyltransferase involved in cellulose biosynthesis